MLRSAKGEKDMGVEAIRRATDACRLRGAVRRALMSDACVLRGLQITGVQPADNIVMPCAGGMDIASV
jgi:hypothetical protein